MKKPDLSKKAIGKFFLHHTEKLILALCLALFGVFLWMGWQSKPFDKETPSGLVKKADRAEQHIMSDASWDEIKKYRVGNDHVLEDIAKLESEGTVKAKDYQVGLLRGVAVLTAEARIDPLIEKPTDLHAVCFNGPLLIAMQGQFENPYADLSPVSAPEIAGGGMGIRGGGGMGIGGLGGEDEMEDEEMNNEEDEDDFGASLGGMGGLGRGAMGGAMGGAMSGEKMEEEEKPEVDAGHQVNTVISQTMQGINPTVHGINPASTRPWLLDIVCGTALIDIKKQVQQFEPLNGSQGYYPDRDKPIYQHLEVQRRLKGTKEWQDRTEFVQLALPNLYPQMHRMPKAFYSSAPEGVSADVFDPVLTSAIPPIAMVDYMKYINHPKLADAGRAFPELKDDEGPQLTTKGDIFNTPSGDNAMQGNLGGGPGMGAPGGMGGGRGMGAPGGMGGGRGMAPGGRGMAGAGAMGGGESEEIEATRAGNDMTDYINALEAKEPGSQYKLVRFFDVDPNTFKAGQVYEYRVRVWLGDPNNEDLNAEFASFQGNAGGNNGIMGGRMGMGDMDGEEPGADFEGDGVGMGMDQESGDEDEEVFTWQKIKTPMLTPGVRERLDLASEEEDPKTGLKRYTISEIRKKKVKNAEGVEEEVSEIEKIAIPPNRSYLRFARPSEWSDPTEVTIVSEKSQVAVGKVIPPKASRMKIGGQDVTIPIGEPASELVASEWSDDYGTAIPTKQKAYRGDLLNYHAPSHIVNPITWQVYMAQSDSEFLEGEERFKVTIRTQQVVVDAMGGEELPLPRAEKMRHHRASELLVMDSKGNFRISNDMEDRTTYRNLLLQPDESQTVGKKKKEREVEDPTGFDGMGAPGGGRGGPGGGGPGMGFGR